MAPGLKPNFQLLEINIISAQDLQPVSKKMRTYATAWVHPSRKLSSCVDSEGKNNPTWNDKFVFRVNDEFLRQDTSAVMIQIYAEHWFRDILVGTVGVLVGKLIPPPVRPNARHPSGMRFVALQVRRPSGRPQGILNIGVALLDSSMRSMPLYRQLSASAVGFRDLMDDPPTLQMLQKNDKQNNNNNNNNNNVKPILRRTKSERSEFFTGNSSIVAIAKDSSIISISESMDPFIGMKKKGKASSVINGAELREKPKRKGKNGKASSVLSDSVISKSTSNFRKITMADAESDEKNEKPKTDDSNENKKVDEKPVANTKGGKNGNSPKPKPPLVSLPPTGKPISKNQYGYEYGLPKGGKYVIGAPFKGSSILSGSEVGPSPSEVAAAMAERKYPIHNDNQSSVLDGWSVDESVEGLKSKLERWRMDLPPLYDRGYSTSTYRSTGPHARKRPDSGAGLFSCFGNIYGYECQCICGKPPERQRRSRSTRFGHSPSTITPGRSFL